MSISIKLLEKKNIGKFRTLFNKSQKASSGIEERIMVK